MSGKAGDDRFATERERERGVQRRVEIKIGHVAVLERREQKIGTT